MQKRVGLVLILVLILAFSGFCFADRYHELTQIHFIIDLKLKDPELVPQIVQYAVLYTDPVSIFKDQVRRFQNMVGSDRQSEIEATWNGCFKTITGDSVYLLTKQPLSYNLDTEAKLWIATKTVHIDQKPICWCIPLQGKIGAECQVVFAKDNRIDLEKLFNEAINH